MQWLLQDNWVAHSGEVIPRLAQEHSVEWKSNCYARLLLKLIGDYESDQVISPISVVAPTGLNYCKWVFIKMTQKLNTWRWGIVQCWLLPLLSVCIEDLIRWSSLDTWNSRIKVSSLLYCSGHIVQYAMPVGRGEYGGKKMEKRCILANASVQML